MTLRKISKIILDKLNTKTVTLTNVRQEKNLTSVIELYKTAPNKELYIIEISDAGSFYLLISLDVFHEVLSLIGKMH